MAKTQFTGEYRSYIFDNAGEKGDLLEQTILKKLEEKGYPFSATAKTLKSGRGLMGAVFGSYQECIVVEVDNDNEIAISHYTVGTYLVVAISRMHKNKSLSVNSMALEAGDIFYAQYLNAVFLAATAAVEAAFSEMGLKRLNSGYEYTKDKISTVG